YLDIWEFEHALKTRRRNVTFKYVSAKVIDRDQPQTDNTLFVYTGDIVLTTDVHTDVRALWNRYPDLAISLTSVPPDAETLVNRFEGYMNRREPLPGMAYFCVTLIEAGASPPKAKGPSEKRRHSAKRQRAADKYRIQYEVIDTLAELSSTRGDAATGRKVGGRPLKDFEEVWMDAAVMAITRRVAELHSTPDPALLPEITMKDLPQLS